VSKVILNGFGFDGFRSFPVDRFARIGPMSGVHLLAGPNNAGKSNVLEVARRILPAWKTGNEIELDEVDLPLGAPNDPNRPFRLSVLACLPVDGPETLLESDAHRLDRAHLSELLKKCGECNSESEFWFHFAYVPEGRRGRNWQLFDGQIEKLVQQIETFDWGPEALGRLSNRLMGEKGGGAERNLERILNHLVDRFDVKSQIPPVKRITAIRRISRLQENDDPNDDDFDGLGLIDRLAELQSPGVSEPEQETRFRQINEFVKTLFRDEQARIAIPHDRETVIVHHEGRRLPLDNYGTGLHEVILIAAAATVLSGHLLCVEEPELHLHPTLQRRLLSYLNEKTDNQYLIATHSASLLDGAKASITAVRQEDGATRVEPALSPTAVARIGRDLGARASDLVQANAVIWVEGPSDRIYLRSWIHTVDRGLDGEEPLAEGVHYSFLFYGGSMLTHLSAEDPTVEEFLSLPRINRHFAVVVDSDRKRSGEQVNETKRRIRRELEQTDGALIWITDGYTIENYIPPAILKGAISTVHPGATCRWGGSRYSNPLSGGQIRDRESPVDKVAIATEVVKRWENLGESPLDLRPQVRRLVNQIREANDFPS
jgi:hypothetical protein